MDKQIIPADATKMMAPPKYANEALNAVFSLGSIAAEHAMSAITVQNTAAKLGIKPSLTIDNVAHYSADSKAKIDAALMSAEPFGLERFKQAIKIVTPNVAKLPKRPQVNTGERND